MKRQNRITSGVLVIVALIFLFGGIVFAQDFSADMVFTTKDEILNGKIFVAEEKVRMEVEVEVEEYQQFISITRFDKNVAWMLIPEEKMYMEQPLKPEHVVATIPNEVERKLIGKELVDGKMTNRYRIVYIIDNEKETIYQWITTDGFPIKTAAVDGSWKIEFKNIEPGKQPATLFEIPAGYQKMPYVIPTIPEMKPAEKPAEEKREEPEKPLIPKIPKPW